VPRRLLPNEVFPARSPDISSRIVLLRNGLHVRVVEGGAPNGEPLMARVGIATGLVVVGELVGDKEARERAAVGETAWTSRGA